MSNPRSCPVCHASTDDSILFQEKNIDETRISGFSFASRKEPEYMCHRLVRCKLCDLVYVSNPPAEEDLAHAYHVAEYDSSEEAEDAAQAYIKAMKSILDNLKRKERVLEIGSGTGILLELLKEKGFSDLIGVEPSSAAIAAAPEIRKKWLIEGIFEEKNFTENSFDLICCFMTMEHVHDPEVIARAAFRLLRDGGAFVTVTHNYHSIVNRLLGKRSPIIDIEHMQLFSVRSIFQLYTNAGYVDVKINAFVNTYALKYWLRLAPLPEFIKIVAAKFIQKVGLQKIKLGINVGNIIAAGYKRD